MKALLLAVICGILGAAILATGTTPLIDSGTTGTLRITGVLSISEAECRRGMVVTVPEPYYVFYPEEEKRFAALEARVEELERSLSVTLKLLEIAVERQNVVIGALEIEFVGGTAKPKESEKNFCPECRKAGKKSEVSEGNSWVSSGAGGIACALCGKTEMHYHEMNVPMTTHYSCSNGHDWTEKIGDDK